MGRIGRALIASLSGIRGVPNEDFSFEDAAAFARRFAEETASRRVLLARDTRSTGQALSRAVASGLEAAGAEVLDFGVVSTPALFRESRTRGLGGVMVTASHNEPEFNGLKFLLDGRGIGQGLFDKVTKKSTNGEPFAAGGYRLVPSSTYVGDLVERFGLGSCQGQRVALDLGGGAAIQHAVSLLRRLGCEVVSVNDVKGVFSRTVDPVADELGLLRRLVVQKDCDIGLAFDCDGDRLVVVDPEGRKKTGDFMLTLALSELLQDRAEKAIVVSLDTTQAVEEVARRATATVFRSKVGEANVVEAMQAKGAALGGEGSSGGLIDGTFNFCRDSLLAAVVIIRAIRSKGRKAFRSVPEYSQTRLALPMKRDAAMKAIRKLSKEYTNADLTDGLKVWAAKKTWVLVRPSGTEEAVRVSAEAPTAEAAKKVAKAFALVLRKAGD
jgi:phosphomannomutase